MIYIRWENVRKKTESDIFGIENFKSLALDCVILSSCMDRRYNCGTHILHFNYLSSPLLHPLSYQCNYG